MKKILSKKNIIFTILFTAIGFIGLQIPAAKIIGAEGSFTLFDFFSPLAVAFIGLIPGLIAIFLTQLANAIVHSSSLLEAAVIIRFIPVLFGAIYFASKDKRHFSLFVPIIAIIAFNLHPIGFGAWQYSMFWLIPIIAYFFREKSLLLRSLGATFTTHAVGGVLWLYTFGLTSEIWLGLIPVVARERLMFGVGIAVSYLVFNNVLNFLTEKDIVKLPFLVNKKYVLGFNR